MTTVWFLRLLILGLALAALACTIGGCAMPEIRCKVVRLGAEPKADIAVRYRGYEFVTVVDVESVVTETVKPEGE